MRAGALLAIALLWPMCALAQAPDPDALYRERTDMVRAKQAAALWEARFTAAPSDFDSSCKFARAAYWLGGHDEMAARRAWLDRGVTAGRAASELRPDRPEGFFWMAANMGALAESYGLRQGLRYRGAIKEALETVLRMAPAFQKGSADRALGRWYLKVPALFGGSKTKSEQHLRMSLTYDPDSTASHFFLAETLEEMDRRVDAVAEFRRVLASPIDPEWEPEDREFKALAEARLARLQR